MLGADIACGANAADAFCIAGCIPACLAQSEATPVLRNPHTIPAYLNHSSILLAKFMESS